MKTVALFNDTGNSSHVGCLAVSNAHDKMLNEAGFHVRYRHFVNEHWEYWTGSRDESRYHIRNSKLMEELSSVDAVVVNGEGTIHHGAGLHLLAILHAAQEIGKPTFIVNAVIEECPHYHDVLARLDDLTVRDIRSSRYLERLRVRHRIIADSILEAEFSEDASDEFLDKIIVTDCHPTCHAVRHQLENVLEHFGRDAIYYPLESELRKTDWRYAVAQLKKARLVVTGRHHGVYLSLMAGTPFVTLPSNTWKIEGTLEILGAQNFMMWREGNNIFEICNAAIRNRESYRNLFTSNFLRRPLGTFSVLRKRINGRKSNASCSLNGGKVRSSDATSLIARQIMAICGPGRILITGSSTEALMHELLRLGANAYGVYKSTVTINCNTGFVPGRFLIGSVLSLPLPDDSFDTIVVTDYLEHLALDDIVIALRELHRVCCRNLFLHVATNPDWNGHMHLTSQGRIWWENAAFKAGFRKQPAYHHIKPYESLAHEGYIITIPLEKIPRSVLARYPLESLPFEQKLHIDMSRMTGPRSDAHMARYSLAAEWIRPGDTVLDCACGLGYGTAILASLSRGKHFLGVDLEDRVVAYARDNFAMQYGLEFRQGNAEDLSFLPNASVDTLVSFETLEHVPHFERFLSEAYRVLKPDGRIILSVPNQWVDETGQDPNPYHFHVFDYGKVRCVLEAQGFIVEARYAQFVPGGFKLIDAVRVLRRRPIFPEGEEEDAEWWILVASANPLVHTETTYSHPDFNRSTAGKSFHVADFARHYHNPWLYRSMVQMGERLSDPVQLRCLTRSVLASAQIGSADYGAALVVFGYQILAARDVLVDEVIDLLRLTDEYLKQPDCNPHIVRWKISLTYLAAMLALKIGDRDQALQYFTATIERDPCIFSPLLATKTVAASFWSGIIHLVNNDSEAARHCFITGVEVARRALHAPDENAIGNPSDPLTFGFPELAEVADMAGQCANALHYLEDYKRCPGKFWRMVDVRRFGLATWALQLETELNNARASLDNFTALWHEKNRWARTINRVLERLLGIRLVRARVLNRLRSGSQ